MPRHGSSHRHEVDTANRGGRPRCSVRRFRLLVAAGGRIDRQGDWLRARWVHWRDALWPRYGPRYRSGVRPACATGESASFRATVRGALRGAARAGVPDRLRPQRDRTAKDSGRGLRVRRSGDGYGRGKGHLVAARRHVHAAPGRAPGTARSSEGDAKPQRRMRQLTGACYQGTTPASSKNEPVGPSSGKVASRIAIAAPCSGVRTPRKPLRSVAQKPGQAALIRILVSRSSLAY